MVLLFVAPSNSFNDLLGATKSKTIPSVEAEIMICSLILGSPIEVKRTVPEYVVKKIYVRKVFIGGVSSEDGTLSFLPFFLFFPPFFSPRRQFLFAPKTRESPASSRLNGKKKRTRSEARPPCPPRTKSRLLSQDCEQQAVRAVLLRAGAGRQQAMVWLPRVSRRQRQRQRPSQDDIIFITIVIIIIGAPHRHFH